MRVSANSDEAVEYTDCISAKGEDPKRVFCVWHEKIWLGSSNAGALGNMEYPFIPIAPRLTLGRCDSTSQGYIYEK